VPRRFAPGALVPYVGGVFGGISKEQFPGRSRAGGGLPCADPRMLRIARRLVPARNGLGARHNPAFLWVEGDEFVHATV